MAKSATIFPFGMLGMDSFLAWCLTKRGLNAVSIRHVRSVLSSLTVWLAGKKISSDLAQSYILHLREKGLKNSSINVHVRVISLLDTFYKEQGEPRNLLKSISYLKSYKRIPTILSQEELEKLMAVDLTYSDAFNRDPETINRTYKLALWTLIATGARFDEVMSLTVSHIQLGEEGYVEFVKTKTHEDRRVPIPKMLVEALKVHIADKKTNELVFTTSRGGKLLQQHFNPDLRKRAKAAGLGNKHVYAHCFRYSYIMEHLQKGTDLIALARLVGHSDLNTTMYYSRYNFDMLSKNAENQFLFSKEQSPQQVLEKSRSVIESLSIMKDARFTKRLERRDNSLIVEFHLR
jgi:site-specific recombinase XerD